MAKKIKKKVVDTTKQKKVIKSTVATRSISKNTPTEPVSLLFGRQNFLLMIAGIVLIALGLLLMSGGDMPSPEVWDESLIYGTRRTLIAPIVILAGLAVEFFAIFKMNH